MRLEERAPDLFMMMCDLDIALEGLPTVVRSRDSAASDMRDTA